MSKLFLIPKEGFKVLDPETYKPLAAEGEFKPDISYWQRRLKDGDVREGAAPETSSPRKPTK